MSAEVAVAASVALAGALAWIIRTSVGMGKLEGRILGRLDAIEGRLRTLTDQIGSHEVESRAHQHAQDREIVDVGVRLARLEGSMQGAGK